MKIIYNENPLRSVVELDDTEKEILLLRIKIEELEEAVFCGYDDIETGDIESAKQCLNPNLFDGDDAYTYANRLHGYLIEALRDTHAGDCTCFPSSCTKCHAEYLMGVSTISGLDKHSANAVYGFFQQQGMTLDRSIMELEAYERTHRAADWLRKYREKHFVNNETVAPTSL